MQYAMLIYQTPEAFEARKNGDDDPSVGAWRAYYKALVDSGAYVGGDPLHVPETATTVRLKDGRRHIQDGPYANTKEQLAGFAILELPSLDAGYSFLYWTNVIRPGGVIDTSVNPTQPPGTLAGPGRPQPQFNRSDLWAHGINLGLVFNF